MPEPHRPKDIGAWAPYQHIERACELLAEADVPGNSTVVLRQLAIADTHLNVATAKMQGGARA